MVGFKWQSVLPAIVIIGMTLNCLERLVMVKHDIVQEPQLQEEGQLGGQICQPYTVFISVIPSNGNQLLTMTKSVLTICVLLQAWQQGLWLFFSNLNPK